MMTMMMTAHLQSLRQHRYHRGDRTAYVQLPQRMMMMSLLLLMMMTILAIELMTCVEIV